MYMYIVEFMLSYMYMLSKTLPSYVVNEVSLFAIGECHSMFAAKEKNKILTQLLIPS